MMTDKEYSKLVQSKSKKSNIVADCIKAFLFGGAICAVGQALTNVYSVLGMTEDSAKTLTSVSLVFLGVLLTFLGIYDNIARHAGAGTLVPITGFANSIASPAIEFKSEGLVLGIGAKLFTIAGPVIVYGLAASVLYGIVLWILKLCGVDGAY